MTVPGWNRMYLEIAREFNYNRQLDYEASVILDSVMRRTVPNRAVAGLIRNKAVFVVGAGTSLRASVPAIKKFKKAVKVAADSAVKVLIGEGVIPDIIVTDLDGDEDSLRKCGRLRTVFAVHAHGDNIPRLYLARSFRNRLGTTQAEPYGDIQNFGGFTDGDRSVFLASYFGAKKIILFGMDYDGRIGRPSQTRKAEADTKLKKLEKSRELLGWLAGRTRSELFTTSSPIPGFRRIRPADLDGVIP